MSSSRRINDTLKESRRRKYQFTRNRKKIKRKMVRFKFNIEKKDFCKKGKRSFLSFHPYYSYICPSQEKNLPRILIDYLSRALCLCPLFNNKIMIYGQGMNKMHNKEDPPSSGIVHTASAPGCGMKREEEKQQIVVAISVAPKKKLVSRVQSWETSYRR